MIDNMFKFQVIAVQLFRIDFAAVESYGTPLLFQRQILVGRALFPSGWSVWSDFGMVPVNKC
jgi:hypothetical protein